MKSALKDCIDHARSEGITLGAMLATLGQAGFCFAALLLAVPFVQPFSLGPLTMVGGVTFIILGWQMGRGYTAAVLPRPAMELRIHGATWVRVLEFCDKILAFCMRFTKPRKEHWVSGIKGERFVGWLVFTGGVLLAMPMANLPFNNSLPALMIVFACVGWLERDGLMVIISLGWGIATVLYFIAVALAFLFLGSKVFSLIAGLWPF